jgi:predicted nucleotide-binding protein
MICSNGSKLIKRLPHMWIKFKARIMKMRQSFARLQFHFKCNDRTKKDMQLKIINLKDRKYIELFYCLF